MTRSHRSILSVAAPAVLLAVLLAGCGSEGDDEPDARGEESSQSPSSESTSDPSSSTSQDPGTVGFEEVAILHETAAGGEVSQTPVVLDSEDAVDGFVGAFTRGTLGEQVRTEVDATDVPEGKVLVGSVIGLGCDVPPGVNVSTDADGLRVSGRKVASPLPECLAPVTTVALVLVDADAVD